MSEVSHESNTLQRVFDALREDGALSLSILREESYRQLDKFSRYALDEIKRIQVAIPPALDFYSDPNGQLVLESSHPQLDLLRRTLCDNMRFLQYFKETEVLFETIRAIETPNGPIPRFHIGFTSSGPLAYFEESVPSTAVWADSAQRIEG